MESLGSSAVIAVSDAVQRKKRQQRSVAEKRRIVEETMAPGASVALVARTHGVNANQLFAWRRLYQADRLVEKRSKTIRNAARLLPVKVSEPGQLSEIMAAHGVTKRAQALGSASVTASAGSIHIQFSTVQIRVEGGADPAALRVVLEYLSR